MTATIKIKPMAGDDVKVTSKQAVSVADKLGITVEFDFNGVTCMARPGDCPDSLVEDFHRALDSGVQFKFARGEQRPNSARKTSGDPVEHQVFNATYQYERDHGSAPSQAAQTAGWAVSVFKQEAGK